MTYALRMSEEIREWLADLHDIDLSSATLVGQALAALMDEGARLGPPLVLAVGGQAADPREALDYAFQRLLAEAQSDRRRLAEAATLVQHLEVRLAEDGDDLAELQSRLDAGREAERLASQRVIARQQRVDALRIRKETLKAAYTAAEARLGIADLLDEVGDGSEDTAGDAASDAGDSGTDAGDAASDAGDAAEVDRSAAVRAKFNEVTEAIEREFGGPVGDLRELRPGALGSGGGDMRLLFTEEPAGTALLISVVEGGGSRDEAVRVSVDVLRRVRAGEDPEAGACQFADKESFLGAFFPDSAGDVDAGAGALAARNRGRSLAEQRKRLGLTQTEVAERMRVPTERVAAIERAEPGATEVGALASYVSALGGYLEIIADFGDERVVVR